MKAFDTIDRSILLITDEYMGVKGNALQLITSYLNNGMLYVSFQNDNSLYANVCGVPQDSIHGPLLFILHISDIRSIFNSSRFILFTNDTTIASAHQNIDILFSQANTELTKLYNWFCLNKLSLNIDKTNYILFSNKQGDL